jgi:hypothetical protein
MPLSATMSGFFTDEWRRFMDGIRRLDPDRYRLYQAAMNRHVRAGGDVRTITVPGWEDFIKTGERRQTTREQRDAWWREQRGGPRADLDEATRRSLQQQMELIRRMRNSAAPEWAQGLGQILTAIDNIQDFLSTLATLGRLTLWGAGHLGLMAGKWGIRGIPGLGWVVTAADLLNYLGMMGLIATPLFGLLCAGPKGALAAGIPTMLMRCSLRQEAWRLAHGGPFGRKARLDRLKNVKGRLPGLGNLFEVGQTTEQLWGYGVSFGWMIGMMQEGSGALHHWGAGGSVQIEFRDSTRQWRRPWDAFWRSQSAGEQALLKQSARILATAPAIHRTQETFTDDEHLTAVAGTLAAIGHTQTMLKQIDVEAMIEDAMEERFRVPIHLDEQTADMLNQEGVELPAVNRWALPGAPVELTGAQGIQAWGPLVAQAFLEYLEPRRNTRHAQLYGAMAVEGTEAAWLLATQDRDALRWQLSEDAQLAISLADSGLFLNPNDGEGRLWALWQAARAQIVDGPRRTLYPADWRALALRYGVTLIPNLGPEAPWPPEWSADTPRSGFA